jgi:hypothetical protein
MHGFAGGVGDVVKFEIEKNPCACGLKFGNDGRSLGREELESDFEEAAFVGEGFDKAEGRRRVGRVHGNDDLYLKLYISNEQYYSEQFKLISSIYVDY